MGCYFRNVLDGEDRDLIVREALKHLRAARRRKASRFDFIAVMGMSGAVIGSEVAHRLKVPPVVVRKEKEHEYCHCDEDSVGDNRGSYAIVDDFCATGRTIRRILDVLGAERCVGFYPYKCTFSPYASGSSSPVPTLHPGFRND